MSGSTRVPVGDFDSLEPGQPYRIEYGMNAVVVVRIGDDVYALKDRCSHQEVRLSEGVVSVDDAEIECYKHGSTFALDTGEAMSLPATKPVPTYPVVVEGEVVFVVVDQA